jgi:CRP-like cAMP-binding protein
VSTTLAPANTARRIPCEACPLRDNEHFRDFTPEELKFVSGFKRGELVSEPGSTILAEGAHSAQLFTLLSGWAFRFKTLEDGRRQILNYLLPGDLVGLQGSVIGEMEHSVESLSAVVLCVFQRDNLPRLFENHPRLAFDVTWLASREERMLDENLLSLGRRSAMERAAYLIAFLYQRSEQVGQAKASKHLIPITQQHVADTLGLSIVHTNKTLKRLSDRKIIRWKNRELEILDVKALRQIAWWDDDDAGRVRPLI